MDDVRSGLQLRSQIRRTGELEISLFNVPTPEPEPDEVVVRVEAAPINPSDLLLMIGAADLTTAKVTRVGALPVVTARLPEAAMRAMSGRIDQSIPVGNEGAGVVVGAGSSDAARALIGRTVAIFGRGLRTGTYAQYRCEKLSECLPLPPGITPAEGASCFVNPLAALAMTGTMRREGHRALVHTAAASNLGQMLNRICLKDGIPLVNIVRGSKGGQILRDIGAKHVVDSTSPAFMEELTSAVIETRATIAFDAVGGGRLVEHILTAMETAANKAAKVYSGFGSNAHKQVYIYGSLDTGPTEFVRSFGQAWSIGGWLFTSSFLMKIGQADAAILKQRVVDELKTTFASHYTKVVSLKEALDLSNIALYARRATGEKFLINPNKM